MMSRSTESGSKAVTRCFVKEDANIKTIVAGAGQRVLLQPNYFSMKGKPPLSSAPFPALVAG